MSMIHRVNGRSRGLSSDQPPPEPFRSIILSRLMTYPKISAVWCDGDILRVRHDVIDDPYRITWREAAELVELVMPRKQPKPILPDAEVDRIRRRLKTLRPRTQQESANKQRVN